MTRRRTNHQIFAFETLEQRRVLDSLPLDFAPWVYLPSNTQEQSIADKVGYDLAHLWSDWNDFEAAGGESVVGPFNSYSSALAQNTVLQVFNNEVVVKAYSDPDQDLPSFENTLAGLGMNELIDDGMHGVAGMLPLGSIYDFAMTTALNFATAAYAGITNIGATTTQGDVAQHSDSLRTTYSTTGAGIKVAVISDSYDTAYQFHTVATLRRQ